jgi:gliding motility-associated-like protein
MTRVFLLVTLFLFISIETSGQCVGGPTVTLSSNVGNTCGTTPATIIGNTFGGSATDVTITATGTGTVSPAATDKTPFNITYTPSNGDIGLQVIITVTTNVPIDPLCTAATATYILMINTNPSIPLVGVITQPTCISPTGSVILSGLPSIGTWTITRTPGGIITTGSGTTTTISGLVTGSYTFTVTNTAGCTSTSSAGVIIDPQPSTPSALVIGTITQPTCIAVTGSVVLSALPSSGSWTIIQNPGGVATTGSGTTTTISGLASGTYTFTVTNSSGCISTASASVIINPQPAAPASPVIGTITQPTCTVSTGSVALSGLPATGSWTITHNPGGVTTTGSGTNTTISGLASGTYTFTVTNASGCISTSSSDVVINPQPPVPAAPVIGAITQPICTIPTGSVDLSGLPSTGSWIITSNPGGVTTTGSGITTTISNLVPGTYSFTVTNSSGCTSVVSSSVGITPQPSVPGSPVIGTIIQPTCTISTGSVILTGLPPTGSWTLVRSPGALTTTGSGTSTTIPSLSEGTYTFTVTNSLGCISPSSGNVVITAQPSIPSAPTVGAITPPTCSLSTGSVVMSGLPSTGTWTLTRYPGAVTLSGTGISITLTGLASGLYNYTLTTSTGCVSVLSANVIIPVQPIVPTPPLIGTITQPRSDLPTGSVVLNGLPGTGSWTLTLTPGNLTTLGAGITKTISGLAPGSYSFTVTNSTGCTSASSESFAINTLNGVPIVVITNPAPVCYPSTINLTAPQITVGSSLNLTYTYWADASGTIPYGTPTVATAGIYYIKGTTTDGFFTIKPVTVLVYRIPLPNAGPDQVLSNQFGATMAAIIANNNETGVWSLISGTGVFFDLSIAKTTVSGLSMGKNIFLWTVTNGVCPSASDTVVINVNDQVTPTLITPNMDGKNDYFILKRIDDQSIMDLIIFDRRGVQVYKNRNYDNSWNGVDYNGKPLPDDTYFYILKTNTGKSARGYIVVRR